jgi:two-component system, NarL family, nitrate/nitrite response regulator NarL
MRVVIADPHRAFAEAVSSLLRRAGHDVVTCTTQLDAVFSVTASEQVDVCLLDASMPGEDLPSAVKRLVAEAPRTAFVLLAGSSGPDLAAGLAAGAHGAALKTDEFVEILRVMAGAASGRAARSGRAGAVLSMAALGRLRAQRRRGAVGDVSEGLTHREQETLAQLVQGQSTSGIARSMGVRVSTARSHVDSVLSKLGAHTRLEAVAVAVREHLVEPGQAGAGYELDSSRLG